MKEKISALLDAELTGKERDLALRELSRDGELRKVWERYHLARAAMRNELEIVISPHFADRVAARIRSEPSPSPSYGFRRLMSGRVTRTAAGLAIAASVAAIALGGLRFLSPIGSDPGKLTQVARNTLPDNYARAEANGSAQEQALNAFLMEHNEFMPSSGVNGVMSYVRLAAYNNHKE